MLGAGRVSVNKKTDGDVRASLRKPPPGGKTAAALTGMAPQQLRRGHGRFAVGLYETDRKVVFKQPFESSFSLPPLGLHAAGKLEGSRVLHAMR